MNNDKIRIMHLNSYIDYGGPSRGILGQVKYTDKNKFQSIIGEIKSTKHDPLVRQIVNNGYEHISLNRNKFFDLSIILKLAILLKKNKVDVLNTHNAIACWHGNIAAKIANIPVVFTLRNNQKENYKFLLKKKYKYEVPILLDRVTMRVADKIVAVSKRLERTYIENEGIPEKKIMTIRNAVDLEIIDQFKGNRDRESIRQEMGIGATVTAVGIVGDLVERKGHACLIEAARIILKENDHTVFLIVGDGPLRGNLTQQIDRYSIQKHFIFTGHVTNVFHYVAAMDIFVLPSYAEGISRALMEAMAMGMPTVCSDNEGNMEAVDDGDTGFIFPMNNHAVLADNLLTLIENKDLQIKMGERARIMAEEKFDMKNLARRYEELYIKLLSHLQTQRL